jgi:hypothetical protein
MNSPRPTQILTAAIRTAATPQLLDERRRRREAGPCEFVLLIPDRRHRKAPDWTLETALLILSRKAGTSRAACFAPAGSHDEGGTPPPGSPSGDFHFRSGAQRGQNARRSAR